MLTRYQSKQASQIMAHLANAHASLQAAFDISCQDHGSVRTWEQQEQLESIIKLLGEHIRDFTNVTYANKYPEKIVRPAL